MAGGALEIVGDGRVALETELVLDESREPRRHPAELRVPEGVPPASSTTAQAVVRTNARRKVAVLA